MTVERPDPTIAVRAPWFYRLITRGATALAFDQGAVTMEGVPERGRVTLLFEEIDQVIENRRWLAHV